MRPHVSIIVTTWLAESKEYLDACMASILNLNYPKDRLKVILVGRKSYHPSYETVETVFIDSDDFGNSEGMNFGASHVSPETELMLFINDDVMLTKNSLSNMVDTIGDAESICGPISPCDNYLKYHLKFGFQHGQDVILINANQYRMEQVRPFLESMMNAESQYTQGAILQDHLYFYCTLIPKKVWDKVGKFDENFKTGPDDIDYSRRCNILRIPIFICLDALVWHFSGVTADKTLTLEMRQKNAQLFEEKWK